jgi:hypothetical protein
VKFSPAFRWSLAVLLPLTLGWKFAVRPSDTNKVQYAIVDFLAQHQFTVVGSTKMILDIQTIEASSGACRLLVRNISPYGVDTELFQHLGAPIGRTFFVFRGAISSQQPVFRTVIYHLWFRLLGSLGLVSHIPPVLAVVSSCEAEQLPWSELRFSASTDLG